jgi:hypothetical protein
MRSVYVSITGFRLNRWRYLPLFWWHTARSILQARWARGNLFVEARVIGGVYHTLTVWIDERAMRAFVTAGSHLGAMKVNRKMGTGRTLGFYAHQVPDWQIAVQRWIVEARDA